MEPRADVEEDSGIFRSGPLPQQHVRQTRRLTATRADRNRVKA